MDFIPAKDIKGSDEALTHRGEGLRQRNDKSEDKEAHLGVWVCF
jgi:hypothetical protein